MTLSPDRGYWTEAAFVKTPRQMARAEQWLSRAEAARDEESIANLEYPKQTAGAWTILRKTTSQSQEQSMIERKRERKGMSSRRRGHLNPRPLNLDKKF